MGKDILVRKKGVIGDRRFLGSNIHVFEDDRGLETFRDCSFFNQHKNSATTTTLDHLFDADEAAAAEIAPEERRIYWESQQFLLEEILLQYHSIGSKLREETKRQIEITRGSSFCNCQRECMTCLRRAVVNQLCHKGVNASLCISQWKRTHKTPAGSHEYIEVIANTQGKRKQIRFLVELGLRDEFRMAKACDEYKTLVNQLPEIYIGKWEHMNAITRLMCEAAKKSAEEQKIHMGPWRKKSFVQMKWSAASSANKFLGHDQTQGCVTGVASRLQPHMPATLKVA